MESLLNLLNPKLRRDIRPVGGRDLDEIQDEEVRRTTSLVKTLAVVATGVVAVGLMAVSFTRRGDVPNVRMDRLVVAPLDNRTGNPALNQLGNLAADLIAQAPQPDSIDVIPYTTTLAYQAVAPLSPKLSDYERALQLARDVHAGYVIWGAYYIRNDSLRIAAQLTDTRTGDVVRTVVPPSFATPSAEALAAREAYVRGIQSYTLGDMAAATEMFSQAARGDPSFTRAQVWHARMLSEAGDTRASDSVAWHIQRNTLNKYDAALLDHVVARNAHRRDVAYRASARMVQIAPGADEALQLHAADALAMGFPREARTVLESVDRSLGWSASWSTYYLQLATAYHSFQNHPGELRIIRSALIRYSRSAEVRLAECRALAAVHRVNEARIAGIEIIKSGGSPRLHAVSAVVRCAEDLMGHDEPRGAQFLFASAYAVLASANPDSLPENLRADMAEALFMRRGHLPGVAQSPAPFETVIRWLGAADNPLQKARHAYYAAAYGRRTEARALDDQLISLPDSLITPDLLYERAKTAAALGNLQNAWELIGEALDHGLPYFDPYRTTLHDQFAFRPLRKYRVFLGLLQPHG